MSTRRKFVITLNLIALVISALSFSIHRYVTAASSARPEAALEMQLVPLPVWTVAAQAHCATSCVLTSRSALGIAD